MECVKCKAELDFRSNFCNKCGEKVEEDRLTELFKTTQKYWFLIGFVKGYYINDEKLKKSLEEMEVEMEKISTTLWTDYKESWDFTRKTLSAIFKKKNKKKKSKSLHNSKKSPLKSS